MKRVYYTTTEYTTKMDYQIWEENPNMMDTDADKWAMFTSKAAAQYDADWMKEKFPGSAKEYGGPKVVKITLKVDV